MKYIIKLYLLSLILIATPMIAMDGVAVIDMRTAVLSTQAAADAFKALEEDAACPVYLKKTNIKNLNIKISDKNLNYLMKI